MAKISRQEFAQQIKSKYPQYQDINDRELADRILKKYPTYQSTVKSGFMPGVQQDIRETAQGVGQAIKDTKLRQQEAIQFGTEGDQSAAESVFQFSGETLRGMGDVVGNLAIGAGKALLPQRAEDAISSGVSKIAGSKPVQDVFAKVENFKQNNPRAGRNISALLGVGEVVAEAFGGSVAKKALVSATDKAGDIAAAGLKTAGRAAKTSADVVQDVGGFATSQVTGLNPSTIKQIIQNPEAFAQASGDVLDRATLASKFDTALRNTINDFEGLGAEYAPIRQLDVQIEVPEDFVTSILRDKYKLSIADGAVIAGRPSVTRSASDLSAIQKIVDDWGTATQLTPQEFLNFRSDLSDLSNFDRLSGKTAAAEKVGKGIRAELNKFRDQVPGLEELDTKFAADKPLIDQLRKDLINPKTGELKDNALSKLSNATGKGKEAFLERLKTVDPEIEDRLKILKSLEDIEYAQGQKVGTYTRSALVGGAVVAGAVTGSIGAAPALALLFLTNPKTVTGFFSWYGKNVNPRVGSLLDSASKKIEAGKSLNLREKNAVEAAMQAPKLIVETYIDTLGTAAGIAAPTVDLSEEVTISE